MLSYANSNGYLQQLSCKLNAIYHFVKSIDNVKEI